MSRGADDPMLANTFRAPMSDPEGILRRVALHTACLLLGWLLVCGVCHAQDVKIRASAPRETAPPVEQPPSAVEAENSSPREMLELLGVASWLDRASDGADFPPEGDELLWRSLYAMRRFSLVDIDRWQRKDVTPDDVVMSPEKFRGQIASWTGTLVSVSRHEPPAEAAERFNLPAYYRCELEVRADREPAIVYALAVPKAWQKGGEFSDRVGVKGLMVMLAVADGDSPAPVLAARRIAWYPETPLGGLEMDVGLFDEITSRPSLTVEDRECFYQLLAAVGRTGKNQLLRAVPNENCNASVEPLFNRPETQRGRLVELTGTAKQAVLRRVEDADIVARFGIDHYYEMQVFTADSQDNPLTFCVRELPPGFPQGERIIEPVRIAGFFFKKWGYRSAETAEQAKPGRISKHLAPLLIGREPVWLEPQPADQRFANGVFLVLFVVLTVVLWFVVSRLSRSDDKFHKQIARRFSPPRDSLDHLPDDGFSVATSKDAGASAADEYLRGLPTTETPTAECEEALRQITARESGENSVAEQYWIRQRRYALPTAFVVVMVLIVVGYRLARLILRHGGW